MGAYECQVQVQSDFLEKITKARPSQALAELIWNGLDADASHVLVTPAYNELGKISQITIRDNGSGVPRKDAIKFFGQLGGSWKRSGATTPSGRFLHGQEGRGRFKAFTLGGHAEWVVNYQKEDSSYWTYTIVMSVNNIQSVKITDEVKSNIAYTGVELNIFNLNKDFRLFESENNLNYLLEVFAIYLNDYNKVKISIDSILLDHKEAIDSIKVINLGDVIFDQQAYPVRLKIVQWKKISEKSVHLCTDQGIPLIQLTKKFSIPGRQFTAYLQSVAFEKMQQSGFIDLAEMDTSVKNIIDQAQKEIKNHFRTEAAKEAETLVDEWKKENIYPFAGEPVSFIEQAERQVFDIVALNVATHIPDFSTNSNTSKSFQFRMLKQALEKNPEDLELILDEVLKLPKKSQEDLANLLREVSLSSIISSAKIVADRLKFLEGLQSILFDKESKKTLKERTQLHRILAQNSWIFGEEYTLSVDDQTLTEVLRSHKKLLGEDIIIDEPVKHVSQTRGIVDLMLSRAIRRHKANDLYHLVIELKRPKVKITAKEIIQTKGYAASVMKDERFRSVNTQWVFWAISDDFDDSAEFDMQDSSGIIHSKQNCKIYVKTWAQVIDENRVRLQFFKERLEYQADKGNSLKFLQENYGEYLHGVIVDGDDLNNQNTSASK